jgi:membrane protease YdiL (CAAX protease family)
MTATITEVQRRRAVNVGIVFILSVLFVFQFIGTGVDIYFHGTNKFSVSEIIILLGFDWSCLILVWFYSIKAEKQPLLIWEEKRFTFFGYAGSVILLYVIAAIVLVIAGLLLHLTPLNNHSEKAIELKTLLQSHKILLVLTCLTAGVTEELIFRGYLLPRLEIMFKSPAWAIIISSLLFGLLHYRYGTIMNMVVPFILGLVFAYYYREYKNIQVVIITHFLWDLVGFLITVKPHQ